MDQPAPGDSSLPRPRGRRARHDRIVAHPAHAGLHREGPYLAWVVVACAIALVSPSSGLVILVGTAPFSELASMSPPLGMRHLLVAALGISVVLRLVAGGWRSMTWNAPIRLA